jgi:hypothetical protein
VLHGGPIAARALAVHAARNPHRPRPPRDNLRAAAGTTAPGPRPCPPGAPLPTALQHNQLPVLGASDGVEGLGGGLVALLAGHTRVPSRRRRPCPGRASPLARVMGRWAVATSWGRSSGSDRARQHAQQLPAAAPRSRTKMDSSALAVQDTQAVFRQQKRQNQGVSLRGAAAELCFPSRSTPRSAPRPVIAAYRTSIVLYRRP